MSSFTPASVWPKWPAAWFPPPTLPESDPVIGEVSVTNPISMYGALLDAAHGVSGLSWATTLITASITVRLAITAATLPPSSRATAIATAMHRHANTVTARFRTARLANSRDGMFRAKQQMDILSAKASNFLSLTSGATRFATPIALVPAAAMQIMTLRFLAANFPSMTTGGFFWCPDLTAASIAVDPYLRLPILCATLQYYSLAMSLRAARRQAVKTGVPIPMLTKGFYAAGFCVSTMFATVTPYLPQAVTVGYWLPSTLLSIAQSKAIAKLAPQLRKHTLAHPDVAEANRLAALPLDEIVPPIPAEGAPKQTVKQQRTRRKKN